MPPLTELLPLVLLAAAPVLAVRAAGAIWRRPISSAAMDGALALAIAAGFLWALHTARVRPAFPVAASGSAWEWVFWFAPAGAILGILEGSARPSRWAVRLGVRLALGAGAAWLVLADIAPTWIDDAGRWLRVALAAVVIAGLSTALGVAKDPRHRGAVAVSTLVALAAGAVVLLRVGRAGVMAEAMTALAVATGAAALPCSRTGAFRLPAAAAPLLALVVGGLTVAGFPMRVEAGHADFRLATAVLLALAPAAGWLVPPRAKPLLSIPLAALAALLFVAAAVAVSGSVDAFEAAPDGY